MHRWLRSNAPRAALLSPLAGLALAYLCLGFIFGVFQQAAIALLPMLVLFTLYGSHLKLPYRVPAGMLAIALGAALVVVLRWMHLHRPCPGGRAGNPTCPTPSTSLHSSTNDPIGLICRLLRRSPRSTRWHR